MWLTDKPIAHRALHGGKDCPENSLAAVRKAIDRSYPVEIDVQLTKDRAIVVFHDEDLFRLTGVKGTLRECHSQDLSGLRLLGTGERIPLLEEVLRELNGAVPVLIEVKNDGRPGPLESLLAKQLESYRGEYAVQSFNPFVVRWFKKNYPSIARGQISCFFEDETMGALKKAFYRTMFLNRWSSPDFIAYDVSRLPYWAVTAARRSGLPVLGWTVRSASVQKRLKPYVDNIIFEGFLPEEGCSAGVGGRAGS